MVVLNKQLKLIKMKKIRLNVVNLEATEILTRHQLKSIFGGDDPNDGEAGGSGGCDYQAAYCGNTKFNTCTTANGVAGKCGNLTAETQCRCIAS